MQTPQYLPGRNFTLRGHRWRIAAVDKGQATCYPARGGGPIQMPIVSLELQRETGHLVFEPMPSTSISGEIPADMESLSAPLRKMADQRLEYVNAFLHAQSQHSAGLPKDEAKRILAEIALKRSEVPPSYESVTRWARSFVGGERRALALAPRWASRGNRKPRLDPDAQTAVSKAVDYWLTKERPTIEDAHAHLTATVMDLNSRRPAERNLAIPSRETLGYAIRHTDVFVAAASRLGTRAARRLLRTRAAGPIATLLLERVEVDHSPIDLLCVDKAGRLIGRPTLSIAIDKASRCPVGVHISYIPPSSVTALECMKNSVRPKNYLKTRFPQIKGTWPCHGIAVTYIVDNGKEFHSATFQALKSTLGTSISYMPGRHPWFKGVVERFFQSQNNALAHNLPGTTKSNIFARGEYEAEKAACLTMEEFESLFMKWLVDIYLNEVHSALGTTPRKAWEALAEVNPPRTLDSDIDLDVAIALIEERRINNGRIRFAGLDYSSPELSLLQEALGKKRNIKFKVNPSDLGAIYAIHPATQTYFEALCTELGYAKGLSLHLHQTLRAMARAEGNSRPTLEELALRKMELKQQTAATLQKAKHRTRKKAKRTQDDLDAHEEAAGPIPSQATKPNGRPANDSHAAPEDDEETGWTLVNKNDSQEAAS